MQQNMVLKTEIQKTEYSIPTASLFTEWYIQK